MEKLVMYRKSLDEIDEKIIELYEKRMNIVKLISRYKKEHNYLRTINIEKIQCSKKI